MEISHADLAEVTRMVFVEIDLMVVHASCHTSSTGVFSMLAYTSMSGGDMTATEKNVSDITSPTLMRVWLNEFQLTACGSLSTG